MHNAHIPLVVAWIYVGLCEGDDDCVQIQGNSKGASLGEGAPRKPFDVVHNNLVVAPAYKELYDDV